MAELVAGAGKPLSREEVNGLLERFLVNAEAAEKLRTRIAKGKALIASSDPKEFDVDGAKVHLSELEEELRKEEWGELMMMGVALAHGAAALLNEAQQNKAWRPPPGSFVRIKMPGFLDLTVDMVEYGDAGGITKAGVG